jgi:hypothetical protein
MWGFQHLEQLVYLQSVYWQERFYLSKENVSSREKQKDGEVENG